MNSLRRNTTGSRFATLSMLAPAKGGISVGKKKRCANSGRLFFKKIAGFASKTEPLRINSVYLRHSRKDSDGCQTTNILSNSFQTIDPWALIGEGTEGGMNHCHRHAPCPFDLPILTPAT